MELSQDNPSESSSENCASESVARMEDNILSQFADSNGARTERKCPFVSSDQCSSANKASEKFIDVISKACGVGSPEEDEVPDVNQPHTKRKLEDPLNESVLRQTDVRCEVADGVKRVRLEADIDSKSSPIGTHPLAYINPPEEDAHCDKMEDPLGSGVLSAVTCTKDGDDEARQEVDIAPRSPHKFHLPLGKGGCSMGDGDFVGDDEGRSFSAVGNELHVAVASTSKTFIKIGADNASRSGSRTSSTSDRSDPTRPLADRVSDSEADGNVSDKADGGDDDDDDPDDHYSSYYSHFDGLEGAAGDDRSARHEYDLLDETKDYDEEVGEDGDEDGSCSSSSDEGEDDGRGTGGCWSDGEVEAMLDEKLEEYQANRKALGTPSTSRDGGLRNNDMSHEREKVILKVRGQDHFEVLPEGWLEVSHSSGMPLYLHKHTRVCTLSKPYFLGPGSVRKHEVPISAIPCLQYRKELDREKDEHVLEKAVDNGICPMMDISSTIPDTSSEKPLNVPIIDAATSKSDQVNLPDSTNSYEGVPQNGSIHPNAKIQTVQENTREKSIDGLKLREYCNRLFEFETITVRRFKTWAGRRNHQKKLNMLHRPTLPIGTKLITCPLPPVPDKKDGAFVNPRREFVMNPNGKSYVCILHEYVQHAMRVQPRYTFKEMENASTPYGATVLIGNMKYGSGFGSSKKHAKLEAAKATLMILIPQMENINPDDKSSGAQQDLAFFDAIRVEDPRISELCAKAGQSSPYQILLECLRRNHGMGDTQIQFDMHTLKHQKNEFKMTVGKHVATVICKNKRDGKQRASQSILQILHPHISTWGSLLRLYGKGSCKTLKEKKVEEQMITELQARTTQNKPNKAILNKLKEEMLKLKTKQNLVVPIGKFISGDLEPPSSSGSNLKNVDL